MADRSKTWFRIVFHQQSHHPRRSRLLTKAASRLNPDDQQSQDILASCEQLHMTVKQRTVGRPSWIQSSGRAHKASATMVDVASPPKEIFTRTAVPAGQRKGHAVQSKPVTRHFTNAMSLIYPQAVSPTPRFDTRRKRSLPPMPSGEHDVAARSRIRAKSEHRSSRRRSQVDSAHGCSSGRYRSLSETLLALYCEGLQSRELEGKKRHNRRSSPVPSRLSAMSVVSQGDRPDLDLRPADLRHSLNSGHNKKSNWNIISSSIKPSSGTRAPSRELFEQYLGFDQVKTLSYCPSNRRRTHLLHKLLKLPKSSFSSPTNGMISVNTTTTFVNSAPISRKNKDLSIPAVSSLYYLRHIVVNEKEPPIFTSVNGRHGSGWAIDTPTGGNDRSLQSVDFVNAMYHPDMYGQRRYNRDSGFWAWSETIP